MLTRTKVAGNLVAAAAAARLMKVSRGSTHSPSCRAVVSTSNMFLPPPGRHPTATCFAGTLQVQAAAKADAGVAAAAAPAAQLRPLHSSSGTYSRLCSRTCNQTATAIEEA